ncbi:hypothetical protein M569_06201 [Genlisea aurea]|uniref:Uncharacterized protein n=1 Tax=Genlisea aurea TaxID=192259 RepID=S8DZ19_9LAMI|nr:hypothetical protein M569_06201 [Genlisea aurea]
MFVYRWTILPLALALSCHVVGFTVKADKNALQKELEDFGLSGYQSLIIPRAPRSIRAKNLRKRVTGKEKHCAIELLASVAEKLSEEGSEGSLSSNAAAEDDRIRSLKGNENDNDRSALHINLKLDCDMKFEVFEDTGSKGNDASKENGCSVSDVGSEVHSQEENDKIVDSSVVTVSSVNDDRIEECVNSDSSVKFPLYREPVLLQKHRDDAKLGVIDDDENSVGSQSRIRMRKITKDYELYSTSEGMKAFYRYRKGTFSRERYQQATLKKRKLSDHGIAVSGDEGTSDHMKVDLKPKDHHVTLSITSFKVPELYFEVPETATIGSLKRTVLESLAAILGVGMRVGIVFQGKKVGDDKGTLRQAGISHCSNLNNLSFTLEPGFANRNHHSIITRCPASEVPVDPPVIKTESVDARIDDADRESMALVPMNMVAAVAAVPLNQKPKRSEASPQRRSRRPFSVSEVEALVEAVEKLGTGRWRDVKILAFENADHRTYVDLKDKWKTLVHTASIAPQQRRGEPVPHELLSRVLSAHSFWSQRQSKSKQPAT